MSRVQGGGKFAPKFAPKAAPQRVPQPSRPPAKRRTPSPAPAQDSTDDEDEVGELAIVPGPTQPQRPFQETARPAAPTPGFTIGPPMGSPILAPQATQTQETLPTVMRINGDAESPNKRQRTEPPSSPVRAPALVPDTAEEEEEIVEDEEEDAQQTMDEDKPAQNEEEEDDEEEEDEDEAGDAAPIIQLPVPVDDPPPKPRNRVVEEPAEEVDESLADGEEGFVESSTVVQLMLDADGNVVVNSETLRTERRVAPTTEAPIVEEQERQMRNIFDVRQKEQSWSKRDIDDLWEYLAMTGLNYHFLAQWFGFKRHPTDPDKRLFNRTPSQVKGKVLLLARREPARYDNIVFGSGRKPIDIARFNKNTTLPPEGQEEEEQQDSGAEDEAGRSDSEPQEEQGEAEPEAEAEVEAEAEAEPEAEPAAQPKPKSAGRSKRPVRARMPGVRRSARLKKLEEDNEPAPDGEAGQSENDIAPPAEEAAPGPDETSEFEADEGVPEGVSSP